MMAGPSHASVNAVADRLAPLAGQVEIPIARWGDHPSALTQQRKGYSALRLCGLTADTPKGDLPRIKRKALNAADAGQWAILLSTLVTAADFSIPVQFGCGDEAGQATEADLLNFLALTARGGHVLVIGDEQQLPARVDSEEARNLGMSYSPLARMRVRLAGTTASHMLTTQYRMHVSIQLFPNVKYYGGALRCGLRHFQPAPVGLRWPLLLAPGSREANRSREILGAAGNHQDDFAHQDQNVMAGDNQRLVLINVNAREESVGRSATNWGQAQAVAEITRRLLRADAATRILVLTGYAAQAELHTNRL